MKYSYKEEENKSSSLLMMLETTMKKKIPNNFNIKELKITQSLNNFQEWDLNYKNENIKYIEKEIDKIKFDKRNLLLKNTLEKVLSKDDKTLKINYNKTNHHSFDFSTFSNIKNNNYINKPRYKLKNKIPHPINHKQSIMNNIKVFNDKIEKKLINENDSNYLNKNNKDDSNYLDNYQELINERKTFELKMHSYIMYLSKHLIELKKKLNDLYNQDSNKINLFKRDRRKSAASAYFGFTPKKEIKEKILKRSEKLIILNYQLTDNTLIYKDKGKLNMPHINFLKRRSEFSNKDKIGRTEREIDKTEKQLLKCIKSMKNYYLDILKKSIDIREEGLIWVIRRLLRINYKPKKLDFPEFIDEKTYKYIIQISNLKNKLYDIMKENEQLNKELLEEKDFIILKNRINEILESNESNNSIINLRKRQRYYSANNKNIDKNNEIYKNISYLDNKFNHFTNNLSIIKLPEDIQNLLFFINTSLEKPKENLDKKNFNDLRNLSEKNKNKKDVLLEKKENVFKMLIQNKSEIYSNKIKLKNKFIKIKVEDSWNKDLKFRKKSVGDIIQEENINGEKENKFMELFNISLDTYKKIERYIILKFKIKDINLIIKKETSDFEKYLQSIKQLENYYNINKFVFENKIK